MNQCYYSDQQLENIATLVADQGELFDWELLVRVCGHIKQVRDKSLRKPRGLFTNNSGGSYTDAPFQSIVVCCGQMVRSCRFGLMARNRFLTSNY